MRFVYQAVDGQGRRSAGELEATTQQSALQQLERQGLTPLQLAPRQRASMRGGRRLRAEELNMALHELATLLSAGVSLAEAVEAQERSTQHPRIASALQLIGEGLRQGRSFPQVLSGAGLPMPRYAYQLIAAGETTGNLASALRDCVAQMEYDRRTREEIRNALIYPCILILSGMAAVAMMFIFVVPKFANLLDHTDKLPWLAWVVLSVGVWSNAHWLPMLVLSGVGLMFALPLLRRSSIRGRLLGSLLRVPLIGDWLMQAEIAQWAKVLGTLLGNRVVLVDALRLASESVRIERQRLLLERVTQDVTGGTALSAALEARQAITATGGNLVRVGERSGRLAEMLDSLATLYEELGRARMRKVLALIEPLCILLIGGVFGLIITGVVLAITSANDIVL